MTFQPRKAVTKIDGTYDANITLTGKDIRAYLDDGTGNKLKKQTQQKEAAIHGGFFVNSNSEMLSMIHCKSSDLAK